MEFPIPLSSKGLRQEVWGDEKSPIWPVQICHCFFVLCRYSKWTSLSPISPVIWRPSGSGKSLIAQSDLILVRLSCLDTYTLLEAPHLPTSPTSSHTQNGELQKGSLLPLRGPCSLAPKHWWVPEYRMAVCSMPPAQLPYRSPVSPTDHLLRIPSFSSKLFCWGPKKTHPLLCVHCPPIQRIENQPLILVIDGNATPHQVQPSFLWASGRQIYTQPFAICFFCCEMQGRLLHHPRSRGRSSGFPSSTLQEGWSEGKHIPPTLLPAYLEHAKDSLNSNFLPLSASWTSTLSWHVWLKDTGGLASLA